MNLLIPALLLSALVGLLYYVRNYPSNPPVKHLNDETVGPVYLDSELWGEM